MENIALGFSGGGFRAACFSLGSLSYLNRIRYRNQPLLQNVKFISSTSGGSITNLLYSSFVFKGRSFEEFYTYMLAALEGEKLVVKALNKLKSSREWKQRSLKTRNLINAFALVYDELFERETFGVYANRQFNPHLEEICITSTEFTNGLAFRFQSQHPDAAFPKGKIGNRYIYFKKNHIAESHKLKLADILASSSCFPSGFEPLIFPNDYTHEQLTDTQLRDAISHTANSFTVPVSAAAPVTANDLAAVEAGIKEVKAYNSYDLLGDEEFTKEIFFGIMDGGVADNQAIDSFKLADNRRAEKKLPGFDLFMACDVASYFMDGYTLPMEHKKWFNHISPAFIGIVWMLCSLVLPALLIFKPGAWSWPAYSIATISGVMLLPVIWLLWLKIEKWLKPSRPTSWRRTLHKYKGVFLNLRIGVLKQMIMSRAKSVFILANDIYMKQIRRMYYEGLFKDDHYKNRVIQNTVYDLSRVKFSGDEDPLKKRRPSKQMIEVAEKARTMGTTLWFDAKHEAEEIREAIIACGQFTTCHNLLRFLEKKDEAAMTPELKEMKAALLADWQKFCDNPGMMM